MREEALNYLNKNRLLNISMIEPICRGKAEILRVDAEGVLLRVVPENIYMLSADNPKKGMELLEEITTMDLIQVHQEFMIEPVKAKYGKEQANVCDQFVYTGKEPLALKPDTDVRKLDESYHGVIMEHYHTVDEPDYIRELLRQGVMHGIFVENQLAGFAGMHSEGSIGLMEIFPEYQRRGLATELQKFMINFVLEKGWVPFGQVMDGNERSLGLQRKLGMECAGSRVAWIF